ncbi:hypothetical protein SAMN04488107_4726 [Geodermatophilus saharensis]|uniref:Uncharacterized protein n=1 Tax=Geodermatophilus saharensis TaxID=1137994 RepID=A0A239JD59_9ACTN|nr:hypothetical protein [Geodermatophilus saharensis]SNT03841.1 hypothetical protein SAMN04488107_4726 [Geodermatophilus saharensis]
MSTLSGAGRAPASLGAALADGVRTLLLPVAWLVALVVCWTLTGATGWVPAGAAVAVWAAGTATWLRRQAWSRAPVHLVTWVVPTALLTPLTALGWLPADGLVLWSPLTTVLAALAVTPQPPATGPGGGR